MDSNGTKDSRDGKRTNEMGGQFAGLHPKGQVPSGKLYPLPNAVAGSWGPTTVRSSTTPGVGLENSRPGSSRYVNSGGQTSGPRVR